MSNGDDETEASSEADDSEETALSPDTLESRLADAEAALEDAGTEADLDGIESTVDAIAADVEAADLPEPDDDDDPDPAAELQASIDELREALEDARGPYTEDVREIAEDAASTIEETRWTEDGEADVREAVGAFLDSVEAEADSSFQPGSDDLADLAAAVGDAGATIEELGLDPDEDADIIADLLEAAETLETALEDAEEWSDLTVREQLDAQGFYDRMTAENRKDFPPELTAVRIAEAENDPERILLALESLESDFMQENCIDALRRLGAPEAFEAMESRAQKRDRPAIEVLGKIGDDRAVEMLLDYVDSNNPPLQRVTLRALGEIGSEEATETVAQALDDEPEGIRSAAARALGLIGDTRAIEPLADLLAEDDSDSVRASAAWALNCIGTERALEAASEYADDRAYLVQVEAERARDATAA